MDEGPYLYDRWGLGDPPDLSFAESMRQQMDQQDYLATDAFEQATGEMMAQLEMELKGAWRAGYDWVHVYNKPTTFDKTGTAQFRLTMCVFPAHSKRPPTPDEMVYRYSYDLRDIEYEDIQQHL